MKRRYKEGDWFRVPLSGAHEALGIIARACQSRLFGYFFAVPTAHEPTLDELRALGFENCVHRALFGGGAIEDMRWELIATSLPFDRDAWAFPHFASRGAFARTWTRCVYDPQSMRIVERHAAEEAAIQSLPDARFSDPTQLEDDLRRAIAGDLPRRPMIVCEIAPPVNVAALMPLGRGGRLQFSSPLQPRDTELLGMFLYRHRDVELRVHGAGALDAALLRRLPFLRSLCIDGARYDLDALDELSCLRRLELVGPRVDATILRRLPNLRELTLVNTPAIRLRDLACAQSLRSLTLRHVHTDLLELGALPALERLELVALAHLDALPSLEGNGALRALRLRSLAGVRDLSPLLTATALRSLEIERMPQLNVTDFRVLESLGQLRLESVDVGSRRKEREVYRLLAKRDAAR